jgi:Xaa-Pro aminopeptidase
MIEKKEFAQRRGRLASLLAAEKVDALLVSALPNVRYLSGFTGSNAVLLVAPDVALLFTDPRYTLQAAEESDCTVIIARKPLHQVALQRAARRKWRRIGFERSRMSYSAYSDLQEAAPLGTSLQPVGPIIEGLRMVKSSAELDLIRKSVQTNSRALDETLRRAKPSWTETRTAAEIEYRMRLLGADGPAFESIVASGVRSALPHARPTANPLGTDRLLLFDIGAVQAGYASDMTRVACMGAPGAKIQKLYRAVLEAQLAAIDAVRAGVTAGSVDRAARSVLKKHKLDSLFVHSTGHGLGLEIHEPPRIGARERTPLQPGMAITIEPGAYIPGFGGVRIEDVVVVTASGCEVLTRTSKELLLP